jgi:hypothetical protein
MGSPRFKVNWDLKERDVVERLYGQVVSVLPNKPFGIYNAYLYILGEAGARAAGDKFPCPP